MSPTRRRSPQRRHGCRVGVPCRATGEQRVARTQAVQVGRFSDRWAARTLPLIVGIDRNSPRVDHPDLARCANSNTPQWAPTSCSLPACATTAAPSGSSAPRRTCATKAGCRWRSPGSYGIVCRAIHSPRLRRRAFRLHDRALPQHRGASRRRARSSRSHLRASALSGACVSMVANTRNARP